MGSRAWKVTRAYARARDGECVECGTTTDLQVDHLDPVGDGGNPFEVERVVTLCRRCHNQFPFV
jgi:5-methylcytosine-specific restriction endonuclease McrA